MSVILATLLTAASPVELHRLMPFAQGPIHGATGIRTAIAMCRAPAEIIKYPTKVLVLIAVDRPERAFNCLSAWILKHPKAGFIKFGFIGSENR